MVGKKNVGEKDNKVRRMTSDRDGKGCDGEGMVNSGTGRNLAEGGAFVDGGSIKFTTFHLMCFVLLIWFYM